MWKNLNNTKTSRRPRYKGWIWHLIACFPVFVFFIFNSLCSLRRQTEITLALQLSVLSVYRRLVHTFSGLGLYFDLCTSLMLTAFQPLGWSGTCADFFLIPCSNIMTTAGRPNASSMHKLQNETTSVECCATTSRRKVISKNTAVKAYSKASG